MSVQSQIDRLNVIKQRIRTNLVAQGITVPDDTKLEAMAEQILSVAGEDGVSPVVTVSKSGDVTTISITDKNGTHTATINDGKDGTNGTPSVEILLPSEAVAVVGVEFNIYHKSILRCDHSLDNIDIRWTVSGSEVTLNRYAECLRINATQSDIGDCTLTVQVKNIKNGTVIAEKSMLLHIIAKTALIGRNVLYIGDSLTASRNGLYAAEIQYNLSGGGMVSIGTQNGASANNQIGDVKHEGYNGATVDGFLSANVTSGNVNPFYNPTTKTFDFAYFMSNRDYSYCDAVCLNLGHNNIGNHVNAVSGLTTIAASIHAYDANIPVIISLIEPLAGQDSWRNSGFTAEQMRTHWRNLLVAYMDAFDNEKIQNVFLSAPYFNVDQDNDFPTETVARCARDSTQIVRQNDSMHPNRIGTLKMADVYFANLLYHMTKAGSTVVFYSVTNNLTNVSSNNTANTIREGSSYSATLTANSGYELDAVSVTMGGQNVNVVNGVISIPSVTGNIVITATATEKVENSVVNLVDPSTATSSPDTTFFKDEWLNGYYISSSISAKAGCIVTDLFPLTRGQKIKVEGILLDTTEHKNRFRWCFFNAEGGRDFGGYVNFATNENVTGGVTIDAANNTAVVDTSALDASKFKNTAYARFSCYPAGANEDIIVSVVE